MRTWTANYSHAVLLHNAGRCSTSIPFSEPLTYRNSPPQVRLSAFDEASALVAVHLPIFGLNKVLGNCDELRARTASNHIDLLIGTPS